MNTIKAVSKKIKNINPELGYAYIATTGYSFLSSHKSPSPAVVLEDGRPLAGPANAPHEDIRKRGVGRYSFWYANVYFSTSDNSDPRTNGRTYEIAIPTKVESLATRFQIAISGFTKEAEEIVLELPVLSERSNKKFSTGENTLDTSAFAYDWLINIWKRAGYVHSEKSTILDFGSGDGDCVRQLRDEGYDAFGCDVVFPEKTPPLIKPLMERGIIRKISMTPYQIPFDDNSFDLIFSAQVFEHVMDYDAAFTEIKRILKPGGKCINTFPGRWKVRESHVYVPFSSVIRSYPWLYLWALFGIRNEHQQGLSARETALKNLRYLKEETIYLTRRQIFKRAIKYFEEVRFAEEAYFYPSYEKFFTKHPSLLPLYRALFSDFDIRVLVLGKRHDF